MTTLRRSSTASWKIKKPLKPSLKSTHAILGAHQRDWEQFVQSRLDAFAQGSPLRSPFIGGEQAKTREVDLRPDIFWLTGATSCLTTLPPDFNTVHTPCMRRALLIHEDIHRQFCERAKANGGYHVYRVTAGEEVMAYGKEQRYLLDERKQLLCNCDYYALKFSGTAISGIGRRATCSRTTCGRSRLSTAQARDRAIPLQRQERNAPGDGSKARMYMNDPNVGKRAALQLREQRDDRRFV